MDITTCKSLSVGGKEVESMWLNRNYVYSILSDSKETMNEFAYSVLSGMDLSGTATHDGVSYNIYNTFTNPAFTDIGTGQVRPWVVSPHIVATAQHWGSYPSTVSLSCGTLSVNSWFNLKEWALANGWSASDFASTGMAEIGDIQLGVCNSTVSADDNCVPYFISMDYVKRHFKSNSLEGTVFWGSSQTFNQAIPFTYTKDSYSVWVNCWYTANSKKELFNADLSAILDSMGSQYPIHSGDSGKPFYFMIDGKPVVIGHGHSIAGTTTVKGPNFIRMFDILKKFVESKGDTLKTLW